jgi:hypothetical protein
MRNSLARYIVNWLLLAVVLAIGSASSACAHRQDQTEFGRIEGVVKGTSGVALRGVKVILTGGDADTRVVVTGVDGRFLFEGVRPGPVYAVRGEQYSRRDDQEAGIVVTGGQTRTINLELAIGCINGDAVAGEPTLDELLEADAIVHVRAGNTGKDEHDGCAPREVEVLAAVRFSDTGKRLGPAFQLLWGNRFERGKEYLLFLNAYDTRKRPRIFATSFEREIVGGRISGDHQKELGIRGGMPVEEALTRLRELREAYSRFRRYDRQSLSSTAGLETLHYKTGWILAGMIKDGSLIGPSFEFGEPVQRSRGLPRANDHVWITTPSEEVRISKFGAKGEALRERRPTLNTLSISDDTGTRVTPGLTYTVADVQLESLPGDDRQFVWLRLVAP